MKKPISLLLFVFIIGFCLVSCSSDNDTDNTNTTMIFGENIKTTLIIGAGSSIDTSTVDGAIFDATGTVTVLKDDNSEPARSEIVLGDTTRNITSLAKTALEKEIRSEVISSPDEELARKDIQGYGIYAADGALAVVWTDEVSKTLALEYFIDKYISRGSLDSATVISDFKIFSLSQYYDDMVSEQKNAEWQKLKDGFIELGLSEDKADDCVTAVRNFYSIADENVYLWLANLYDPEIGGFYYSNSGRDTGGFLPDVESTLQALNILQNNGMFDDFGDTAASRLRNALPKEMQDKIVEFVKGLQSDVDGYFHHPQWAGMDSSWTSRLNRDLNWSVSLLEWFDASPNYSLPTVRPVSRENLTGRLGGSTVSLVSKVIAVDSANMEFLATPETFRAYLESFDWESQSYQAANTIGSFTIQLNARGQEYIDVYDEFLRERQNPENGLWEDGVYYASTNGLMKVVAAFNSLGIELQYPDKAFESAITMAKHTGADEEGFPANHIVDVYNPWYVMSDILTNVEMHGNTLMAKQLRNTLLLEAEELIVKSMEKTAPFKKNDGSFGYNWDYSPNTSQGAPVSVPGTVEGDVNGCVMCFGVIGNLLETLGVEKPRRYYINDYLAFIDEIENLGAVIKNNEGVSAEVITFDDEPLGNSEPDAFSSVSVSNGIAQTELKAGSDDDVVFHITDTSSKTGTSIRVTPGGVPVGASRCVVEFDINVKSATGGVFYQIFFGSTYQLTLTNDGSNVSIGDSSTKGVNNDFGVIFKKDEWHKIRVEYFFTGDASTTVTKIYLDGHLRAMSDNFYGKLPEGASKPDLLFHELHFYTLFDPTADVYLDNIFANKDREIYREEPVTNPYRVSDFEDTEDGKLPVGVTGVTYNDSAVVEVSDNPYQDGESEASGKVLHFSAPAGGADITKRIDSFTDDGNVYIFESDVYISDITEGSAVTQTYFRTSGGSIFSLTLVGGSDSLGRYADICILDPSNNSAKSSLAKIYLNKWTKLRIEYYRYQYELSDDGNLWNGVKVRVLLNGEEAFNGLCDYPNPNTLSKPAISFFNYVLNGKTLDMYFDNMIFEVSNIVYADENGLEIPDPENPSFPGGGEPSSTPAEDSHDGVFDFEGAAVGKPAVPGLSTAPNSGEYGNYVEVAEDSNGNTALKFTTVPSEKSGNSAQFEASKLSPADADCHIVEFSMLVERAASSENYVQLYMYDGKSNLIYSFNILMPTRLNGNIDISSRLSSSVSQSSKSAEVPFTDGYIKFRFEYYKVNGMTKIYVNDAFVFECYGSYDGTGGAGAIASFKMTTLIKSEFILYVDDVTVKSVNKQYISGT